MTSIEDDLSTDPHATLAQLRQAGPVHRLNLLPQVTSWLITGHADTRRALADQRLVRSPLAPRQFGPLPLADGVRQALNQHMLNADPPDHTRLRKLASAAFTARRVEWLRPRIQKITDDLLDGLSGHADVIDDFAFPLPFQVICELVGVPTIDRDAFRAWSGLAIGTGSTDPNEIAAGLTDLAAYVHDLIDRKRAEPDDALLSGLISASDAGDRLTEQELTSLVFLLLVAGHETTVNLIGNATYLLLGHPEQAAALRADESLLPAAIEEFLRYESPVKVSTTRILSEPLTVGDTTIPAGELVMTSLLSANRDATVIPDPDELRFDRADVQHTAFGHGIHYCLGAPLARLEGQIAIGGLLRRFPAMRPAVPLDELVWRPGILVRGLVHLPVILTP